MSLENERKIWDKHLARNYKVFLKAFSLVNRICSSGVKNFTIYMITKMTKLVTLKKCYNFKKISRL